MQFPALYGTRKFIQAFAGARRLSWSWVLVPISILEHNFNIILPSTRRSSKWSLSSEFPHQNSAFNCHTCHMHYPPQSSFDIPDATRSVHIIEVLIMHFIPVSCCIVRLRHKYPPRHPMSSSGGESYLIIRASDGQYLPGTVICRVVLHQRSILTYSPPTDAISTDSVVK